MSAGREEELKLSILTPASYRELACGPQWGKTVEVRRQRNHYFDTDGFELLARGALLRVRQEAVTRSGEPVAGRGEAPGKETVGKPGEGGDPRQEPPLWRPGGVLTLKAGGSVGAGHFDSEEVEESLDEATVSGLLERTADVLALNVAPVVRLRELAPGLSPQPRATLDNLRIVRELEGLRLEVDCLRFPDGQEHHELEIETDRTAEVRAWLDARARRLGVELLAERLTKLERLVEWLRSQGPRGGHHGGAAQGT